MSFWPLGGTRTLFTDLLTSSRQLVLILGNAVAPVAVCQHLCSVAQGSCRHKESAQMRVNNSFAPLSRDAEYSMCKLWECDWFLMHYTKNASDLTKSSEVHILYEGGHQHNLGVSHLTCLWLGSTTAKVNFETRCVKVCWVSSVLFLRWFNILGKGTSCSSAVADRTVVV